MSESFKQFKAKFLRKAIIISCVSGVCGAAFVCGALLLAFKLSGVEFFWALYIPVALAAGALCAGLAYLTVRPTDVKVAKQLDEDYGLNERVQTMVEYDGKEGGLVELQRRDADKKLSSLTPKKIKISTIVSYAVAGIVACAMFFTAVFVPAKAKENDADDPTFIITDWQSTAIKSLINDVNSSSLAYEIKTTCVVYLDALLELLDEEIPSSEMRANVEATMSLVVKLAADANSYSAIAEQFALDEELEDLAGTLTDSAKSYGAGRELTSYQRVLAKRDVIDANTARLFEAFAGSVSAGFAESTPAELITGVPAYANRIKSGLAAVAGWDQFDDLYKAASDYADRLIEIIDNRSGYATTELRNMLGEAGATFADNGAGALRTQSYTEMMCEYVRRSLASIFGITIIDPVPDNTPGENETNPDGNGGGGGGGGIKGGSDDEIFDTGTGEYKPYLEVWDKFSPAVDEILQRDDIPEELKNRIRDYFRNLRSENNQD